MVNEITEKYFCQADFLTAAECLFPPLRQLSVRRQLRHIAKVALK